MDPPVDLTRGQNNILHLSVSAAGRIFTDLNICKPITRRISKH